MNEKFSDDRVLYEDNHLIVVNKKSGDIVQGDKTGDQPLSEIVKEYLQKKYNKPGEVFLGIPHRIDRPTSGIVIFAKTSKALSRMNQLFQDKKVEKTYWAIVGKLPSKKHETLVHYLKKNHAKNRSLVYNKEINGVKQAVLSYKVIHHFNHYYLLEIKPKTGRHHQIRVQLSAIGCPIKGDLKYGFNRSNPDASISLHARAVLFNHPVKNTPISIKANPISKEKLWKEACEIFQ